MGTGEREEMIRAILEEERREKETKKRDKKRIGRADRGAFESDSDGEGAKASEAQASKATGPVREGEVEEAARERAAARQRLREVGDNVVVAGRAVEEELEARGGEEGAAGGAGPSREGGQPSAAAGGRKRARAAGSPSRADLARGEEDLTGPGKEGDVVIEPFNLREEREKGAFDSAGNYVERKARDSDSDEEPDAWVAGGEGQEVVAEEVVARLAAEREASARAEAASARPPTAAQLARWQLAAARQLRRGETAAEGLRRLGHEMRGEPLGGARGGSRRPAPRRLPWEAATSKTGGGSDEARRGVGRGSGPGASRDGGETGDEAARAAATTSFEALSEASASLFDGGLGDVYSTTREALREAASATIDLSSDEEGEPPAPAVAPPRARSAAPPLACEPLTLSVLPGGAPAALAGGDDPSDEDDLFGGVTDEGVGDGGGDEPSGAEAPAAAGTGTAAPGASAPGPSPSAEALERARSEFAAWPIKELRRYLKERGADSSGAVERADLISLAAYESLRAEAATAAAPPGYVLDPETGKYFSSTGMTWDPASGAFWDPRHSKWFFWDTGKGEFRPAG